MVYLPEEDSYLLIEAVRKHLGNSRDKIILEMGVGSGIISIYLADYAKKVYAVDVDKEAIAYTKKEIKKVSSRREKIIKNIHLINSNLFSNLGKELRFDLIVFNPPYLPNEKKIDNDIALNGGPEGNEVIIDFLEQAKDYLSLNGEILLLFSSFSKRNGILKRAKELGYDCKLLSKKTIFFEKLYVYKFKPKEYLLAYGHRGKVYIFNKGKKRYLRKVPINSSKESINIENEAKFNKLLNKYKIAPKFISYDKKTDSCIREFIDGERINDYFANHSKEEIISVIKKIFIQLLKMDELKINKFEMTNPYKHIIIDKKNNPHLIDFERCRYVEQPKNVTQFLQYLTSGNATVIFKKKKIIIDKAKVVQLSKDYKKSYDKELILKFLEKIRK
jgi:release factor glutamine methyltransferase